jgi:uncharacterized membrane protein
MQTTINIPIPLLVFFVGAILALVMYFIKEIHNDIKKVIEGLTKAVHGLEIVTTNMETKGNHIKERVEDLEGYIEAQQKNREVFFKDYGSSLEWLKNHLEDIQILTRKKH